MYLGRILLCVLGWAIAMVVVNAVYARSAGRAERRRQSAVHLASDKAITRLLGD
ncbi:MAG TPA: hypothetical protein VIK97_19395 [Casimicrobiaceae bacterium]